MNSGLIKINAKAINKSEIARRVGLSQSYVSKLLNGERKNKKALRKVLHVIKHQVEA